MAESFGSELNCSAGMRVGPELQTWPAVRFSSSDIIEFCDNFTSNLEKVASFASLWLQVVMLMFGLFRIWMYRKYAVIKPESEKSSSMLLRWQIKLQWMISVCWIVEAVILGSFRFYQQSINALTYGSIISPLLIYLFQFDENNKFSTPSRFRDYFCVKKVWSTLLILDVIGLSCQLYLWGDGNPSGKVPFGFLLIRTIFLYAVLFIEWQKEGDKLLIEKASKAETIKSPEEQRKEKEDWKNKTFEEKLESVTQQWSHIKTFMNVTSKAKVGIFICGLTISIERGLALYSEIVVKDLLDSISSIPTANGSHFNGTLGTETIVTVGSIGIKFRWDLLLIQTILYLVMYDLFRVIQDSAWDSLRAEIDANTQISTFKKIQNLSLSWHLEKKTGESYGVLRYGSSSFFYFLNYFLLTAVPGWLDVILYLVYVAAVYPKILNAILCLTTVAILTIHFITQQYKTNTLAEEMKAQDEKMSEAIDSLMNFETVKYFTNEAYEEEKFTTAMTAVRKYKLRSRFIDNMRKLSQAVVKSAGSFLGSLFCYWMLYNNEGLTVGDYHMFGSHIYKFYYPFLYLSYLHSMFATSVKEMDKMATVLKEEVAVVDSPTAHDLEITPGESDIIFDNVHFSYVPERKILHGISFKIPPGKTYALVGPTGCGKSTVIRLLFRFYDTTSGSIRIGGQDIQNVKLNSLRKAIGVIPQDTVLFHQSIMKNILYGDLSTPNPQEDVEAAAKCACIHDKILTFPQKYETIVGSRGLKLSGGEKQRISIARTVLKNPPILLMDEATSSLDSQTEKQIQSTLETVCKSRTTLIIAHRLTTIINVDKILVLDEGRLIESGSHKELLDQNGMYAKMWNEQFNVSQDSSSSPS